jgi:hypothetical protein
MLDIQHLRSDIDALAERLATRGFVLDKATFQNLESERKTLQTRTQDLQASRNSLSKQVGMLKGRGEDAAPVMAQVAALKSELEANESASASCSRNSMPSWRCCPTCPTRACRSENPKPTTSKSNAGARHASLTLPSRITSISAKRSVNSTSPPQRKLPARAFH